MVLRKKKNVEEKVAEEEVVEEEAEEEVEVPEIEPAPALKSKQKISKERTEVVWELPARQIREEVIDGVLIKYMTVTEYLTEIMNEVEE